MHFVVHALDKPDALGKRLAVLSDHRAYLGEAPARHGIRVLLSGPLVADEGEPMKGSFFLLDAPDRAAVEALVADDPMNKAEVWVERHITAFELRTDNMSGT